MGAFSQIAAALTVSAAVMAAHAADRHGNYAVWGTGNTSCNQFNKARLAETDSRFREYLSGYFSHYNESTAQTTNIAGSLSMADILGRLDVICTEQPVLGFHDALGHLVRQIYPHRQRSKR